MILQSRPWQRLNTWQSFYDVNAHTISHEQNDYVAHVCKERNNGK